MQTYHIDRMEDSYETKINRIGLGACDPRSPLVSGKRAECRRDPQCPERSQRLGAHHRPDTDPAACEERRALQEKREVYYYTPCLAREEYVRTETKNFIEKFFKGSSKNLAAALVDSNALTKKDIEELRDYFNQNL